MPGSAILSPATYEELSIFFDDDTDYEKDFLRSGR